MLEIIRILQILLQPEMFKKLSLADSCVSSGKRRAPKESFITHGHKMGTFKHRKSGTVC